jgi:hypothetical protein
MDHAISDEALVGTLSRYAALAGRLLDDPAEWLGDDEPVVAGGRLRRFGDAVADRLTGDVHPGSAAWSAVPLERRVDWWVDRVAAVAAPVAATPRIAGVAADRLPIQGALGAAAQGLAVCAVAREHGVVEPAEWVPLLGRVLLGRDLPSGRPVADDALDDPDDDGSADAPVDDSRLRRGGRALWRLARVLLAVRGLFDERPRGAFAFRALGKLPIVGLVGGVLDERGGVRKAAEHTQALLRGRPA